MTARLKKLTTGDKLTIRLKVGRLHAATPIDEVLSELRKSFAKNVNDMVTPGYIKQAEDYARMIHSKNLIEWRRWSAAF